MVVSAAALVVFCVLFGLPIIGTLSMRVVYHWLGCQFGFDYQPACMVMGVDISKRVGAYGVPLLGMLLTPIIFIKAFWELLLGWSAATLVLALLAAR